MLNIKEHLYLIGTQHTFPDGIKIKIVDIKQRELEPWITYETDYGSSLPRRFSLKLEEFLNTYGHLWGK